MDGARAVMVVGAGLMGVGIGLVFAQAGHPVRLVDVDAGCRERALPRLRDALSTLVGHGLLDPEEAEAVAGRVSVAADLDAAWPQDEPPILALEAVSEQLPLKRDLLSALEARSGSEAILLSSNTSGLSISAIGAGLQRPDRLCGMHFWNPPHLIPLVEVVQGNATSEATMTEAVALLAACGKRPVVVRKDIPGFLGNRLLHALQREAMALVAAGVASAEDVDSVVTHGFGRRLGAVGPLAVCDLAGLDLVLDVDTYLLPDLDASPEPSPLLRGLVARGNLGVKTGTGFHTWSEKATRAAVARRDAALIHALREDRAG